MKRSLSQSLFFGVGFLAVMLHIGVGLPLASVVLLSLLFGVLLRSLALTVGERCITRPEQVVQVWEVAFLAAPVLSVVGVGVSCWRWQGVMREAVANGEGWMIVGILLLWVITGILYFVGGFFVGKRIQSLIVSRAIMTHHKEWRGVKEAVKRSAARVRE